MTAVVKALLRHLCGEEHGFALVMALGMLAVLTIVGTTLTYYATSDGTAATTGRARMSAFDLAEAGLSDALATMQNQLNSDGTVKSGAKSPIDPTLLPQTTVQYASQHGSVTYSGTLDTTEYVWTITSTGQVKNDQGYQRSTLKKSVTVRGLNVGANGNSWSRFYQDSTSSCLTIDTDTMVTNIGTRGNLCLVNGGSITGASTNVDVGGTVTISGPDTTGSARPATTASGWTSSNNVFASDSVYATNAVSSNSTGATLTLSGFGFSIPSSAIIRGITVSLIRKGSVSGTLQDANMYLTKAGSQTGSNHAISGTWGTSNSTKTYGSSSDLWGAAWTAADINNSGFGIKFAAKAGGTAATASADYVSIAITYSSDTNGIGTPGTPINQANIGGTCTYNANSAHTPCTSADHVYAGTITTTAPGSNPALVMPQVDFNYWWANAMPGPKHPCTSSTGTPPTFDNDAGSTNGPNDSVPVNGEMAPPGQSYDCQVVENGVLKGELGWNATTHVLTIFGTIFIDGNFRFDSDGEIVHYQGKADLMSGGYDEIDAVVCAGGSGTTEPQDDCISTGMSNWDPSQNYMTLMSMQDNEYDQGGSSCNGSPPTCLDGHPQAGFQGVLYSQGNCLIHQGFQDSGPVICDSISIPHETTVDPTFYTFPYTGNLTDGQKYGDTSSASAFELDAGAESGG